MAQSLSSLDINSPSQANALFGEHKGLLVCRPGRACLPWITIPEGCYGLVTDYGKNLDYTDPSTGKSTAVWPAGFHKAPPSLSPFALSLPLAYVLLLFVSPLCHLTLAWALFSIFLCLVLSFVGFEPFCQGCFQFGDQASRGV